MSSDDVRVNGADFEASVSRNEAGQAQADGAGATLVGFFDDARSARYLALCIEPGVGGRDAISSIVSRAAARGTTTICRDLIGVAVRDVSRVLSRLARERCSVPGKRLVAIEGMPPSDEHHVDLQAGAIRRIEATGASVVLLLPPEARQLLEALSEFSDVWTSDLVAQGLSEIEGSSHRQELISLTRGIPSLLHALGGARYAGGEGSGVPQAYYDAYGTLVGLSLRHGLSDEELSMRLAMLLLGQGTADELAELVSGELGEALARLRSDAPLFGITERLGTFHCLGWDSPYSLALCLPRLRAACSLFPRVYEGALRTLMGRGDYGRVSQLCKMLEGASVLETIAERGAEFLEIAEVSLVRHALSSTLGPEGWRDDCSALLVEEAADALSSPRYVPSSAGCLSPQTEEERIAFLLAEARRVLRRAPSAERESLRPESPVGRRLLAHRDGCALLAVGRVGDATRLLLTSPRDESDMGVSGALLALDGELTRVLMGDGGGEDDTTVGEALAYVRSHELRGLRPYASLVALARSFSRGEAGAETEADALVARAERSGDALVQVGALLVACVCDMRKRAFARANVRALLAQSVSRRASSSYLERVARLFGEVARFQMGERVATDEAERHEDDLDLVRRVVESVLEAGEDVSALKEDELGRVPRDAMWVLRLLASGLGDLSSLLRERVPAGWRRSLDSDDGRSARMRETVEDDPLARPPFGNGETPIEVALLGGCALYVKGVRVPDWKLERRNAKVVLEHLLLSNGGSAQRFQLVERIWPECEYATGFNKAYQATSALRAMVAEIDPGLDPFVASRTSGEISLDLGLVSCDVDLFRSLAREAADAEDPERALALARRAERLYAGDLYVPPTDQSGHIMHVRDELRALYADAMVAGGDAALRLGMDRTAARLASNALLVNELREDAMAVVVRALRADGRGIEADRQYRRFRSRLRRASGREPSPRLLEAMGEDVPSPRA